MGGTWLFKTEPKEYSYDRLEKEGRTVWDGVSNALALRHLREVRRGDPVFIYHTGDEKAVVGLARAASDPYPDPMDRAGRLVVIDVEPDRRLERPVPLAEIKARRDMAGFDLVRLGRLSVMPVSEERREAILEMSRRPPGPAARAGAARARAPARSRAAAAGAGAARVRAAAAGAGAAGRARAPGRARGAGAPKGGASRRVRGAASS